MGGPGVLVGEEQFGVWLRHEASVLVLWGGEKNTTAGLMPNSLTPHLKDWTFVWEDREA